MKVKLLFWSIVLFFLINILNVNAYNSSNGIIDDFSDDTAGASLGTADNGNTWNENEPVGCTYSIVTGEEGGASSTHMKAQAENSNACSASLQCFCSSFSWRP